MIRIFESPEKCCGCGACAAICPKNAIHMDCDSEGFLYPQVNEDSCVECEKCTDVCAFSRKSLSGKPLKVFAVKNKNENIRKNSSSGGVFTSLYEHIIHNGGTVYGAAFDKEFAVKHFKAESMSECEAFRGSKYVQSDLNDTFELVKQDLLLGKTVLYSGTPCQIAGLKNYIQNIDSGTLFTVDLVCHGVPSPLIWKKYINIVGLNLKIKEVNFRDKKSGWHNSHLNISSDKKVLVDEGYDKNAFGQLFFHHYILRPSCSECQYASISRVGDITIGDFWGIENSMPEFDDNKGISLVLVNTENGEKLIENIKNTMELRESDVEKCLQPNLLKPSQHSKRRDEFWKDYYKKGIVYVLKKYTSYGERYVYVRIRRKIKKIMRYMKKYIYNNFFGR